MATFGTFGVIAVWRLLRWRGPEITLSADSIRDKKVSDDPIPWSEVANISPYLYRGKIIGSKLYLSAAFLSGIRLRLFVKLVGPATGALGSDYVVAGPGAVRLGAGEFHDLAVAYWTAYHHKREG